MRVRRLIVGIIIVAAVAVFIFAPVLYGFQKTVPAGVNVTFYESPSCKILNFGGVYVSGQSINGNGQTVGVSAYQFLWDCEIP